jgi:diphthine synthase
MDMLTFIGLGLYDERSITLQGQDALQAADRIFAEFYTSELAGTTVEQLERTHGVEIDVRDRAGVEQAPGDVLAAAADGDVAFLTGGDPMVSTTHVDLRLRAHDRGIETRIVHGTTAQAAASSLTGLQNYRFGTATTLPFERSHGGDGVPGSVLETIAANRDRDLHTLVYLDIDRAGVDANRNGVVDREENSDDDERGADSEYEPYMTGTEAAALLEPEYGDAVGVVVGQAGSESPTVRADRIAALADEAFGPPLHLLVVPASLHPLERDALVALAGAPPETVSE